MNNKIEFPFLDIPKKSRECKVVRNEKYFFILVDKNGNEIRKMKTPKTARWRVEDIVTIYI